MSSLTIGQFANIKELAQAFAEREPFRSLTRSADAATLPFQLLLLAPAILADWIARNASQLAQKPELKITLVSPGTQALESIDEGRWYTLLPELLGQPNLKTHVSLVTGSPADPLLTGLARLNLPFSAAKRYEQPVHGYLENLPDGRPDLLVLFDADLMMNEAAAWSDPLANLMNAGVPTLAVAASEDEHLLISGLLGLYGFESKLPYTRTRFSTSKIGPAAMMDNFIWGSCLWDVTAHRRAYSTVPGKKLEHEANQAVSFVRAYTANHRAYPPLQQIGVVVEGKESPAPDGRKLITLPEQLYFDPVNEKLSSMQGGGLASIKELDEYAGKSALLATYEGRTSRFSQMLWAVRVFAECANHMPSHDHAEDADAPQAENADDTESEVCPGCGHVHSREDRIEGAQHVLSHVLDDEPPEVRIQAALRYALSAAEESANRKRNNQTRDEDEDSPDDEPTDLGLYEILLRRGYVRAAFGMWTEEPDLDTEGRDEDGWPLAMLAVMEGELTLFNQMLDSGIDFECRADDGQTIFHALALLDSHLCDELPEDLVVRLSDMDISPNTPDDDGDHPLETAAYNENWPVFELLLNGGADLSGTRLNMEAVVQGMRKQNAKDIAERLEARFGPFGEGKSKQKKPARKKSR